MLFRTLTSLALAGWVLGLAPVQAAADERRDMPATVHQVEALKLEGNAEVRDQDRTNRRRPAESVVMPVTRHQAEVLELQGAGGERPS